MCGGMGKCATAKTRALPQRGLDIRASSFFRYSCFVIVRCREQEYEQE